MIIGHMHAMMRLILADGIDSDLWIYLVLAAVSVIGTILGKKKKDEQQRSQRSPGSSGGSSQRPPVAKPVPPVTQRLPRPPQPSRVEPRAMPPAASEFPEARPARRRTMSPVPGPIAPPVPQPLAMPVPQPTARPLPRPAAQPIRLPVEARRRVPVPATRVEPVLEEVVEIKAELAETETPQGERRGEHLAARLDVTLRRGRGRPCGDVERAGRALRDRSGLRAAFILSEILAPPVALRENHSFDSR